MMTSLPNQPLRRQALWVVACRVVGIVATLASNIVAARLLGPAEFGVYLLVTSVIALGSVLAMAGLNEAALRFISESLAHGKTGLAQAYLQRSLKTAAFASVLAAIVATGGFALFRAFAPSPQQSLALLALVAVGITALAWQQLGAELVRAYGDIRLASLFSGGQTGGPLSNLLFLAGLCAATFAVAKIDATLVAGIAVGSFCLTCPLLYLGLSRLSRVTNAAPASDARLSRRQRRELLAVGGFLLVNQLLAFTTQQFDIWLAGGLLTSEALGLYGAAKRSLLITAMPAQMAMLTIVSTIPRLHAHGRTAELQRVVRGAATSAAVPALAALLALALFPRQLLSLVFDGRFAGAESTLLVMALGYFVLVITGNPQQLLTMTGRHRTVLAVNIASALTLVIVGVIGGYVFGAPGLAAGAAASLALQNGALWWLARRELGIWTHIGLLWSLPHRADPSAAHVSLPPREPNAAGCDRLPDPLSSSGVCP